MCDKGKTCLWCKNKYVNDYDQLICDYSEEKVDEDDTCDDFRSK